MNIAIPAPKKTGNIEGGPCIPPVVIVGGLKLSVRLGSDVGITAVGITVDLKLSVRIGSDDAKILVGLPELIPPLCGCKDSRYDIFYIIIL